MYLKLINQSKEPKEEIEDQLLENIEEYRNYVISQIKENANFLYRHVASLIGHSYFTLYLHGSILDKKRFNENSDIDLAVSTKDKNKPQMVDSALTEKLAGKIIIGDAGYLDVVVMNMMTPEKRLQI